MGIMVGEVRPGIYSLYTLGIYTPLYTLGIHATLGTPTTVLLHWVSALHRPWWPDDALGSNLEINTGKRPPCASLLSFLLMLVYPSVQSCLALPGVKT